jgi:hypothetical protein
MSSNKLSRFQHLERSRGEKTPPEGRVRLQDGSRFESVTGPAGAPPATVAVPEAHVERFKLHGQTPLALDGAPEQAHPFPRCVRCQTDNGRFAQVCTTCGADLQSPEQRAYDAELGRSREQAEARTREQESRIHKAHQEARAEQLAEQQRYMEQLRRALEEERSLLSRLPQLFTPCLGVGLLRLIPHPFVRWATLAWALGLPLLFMRFGHPPLRKFGLYLEGAILLSFIPTWLWRERYGRRWW